MVPTSGISPIKESDILSLPTVISAPASKSRSLYLLTIATSSGSDSQSLCDQELNEETLISLVLSPYDLEYHLINALLPSAR